MQQIINEYIDHGLALCPIPPRTKGPSNVGWQRKENTLTRTSLIPEGYGLGLCHAYSGTMALDIDSMEMAKELLGKEGICLQALLDDPDAVKVNSGRPGRGKLIYRVPAMIGPLRTKKISIDKQVIYELRCETADGLTMQDCIYPTYHPNTGKQYQWEGDWKNLPIIPTELLNHWNDLIDQDKQRTINTGEGKGVVNASWDEIESALYSLDPNCSREDWFKVGTALHWAGAQTSKSGKALDLWDSWSQGSPDKYPGEHEIYKQWNSFKSDKANGITLGTLFHAAKEAGWTRPQVDVSGLFDRNDSDVHPLARVRPLNTKPQPVNWLIPGVVQQGLVVIAGSAGVGKTTNLLPMLLSVAHLCPDDSPVRPPAKRKIVWITEDPNQVERIVSGMVMDSYFTQEEAEGWLNVVDARRMPIDELVAVEPDYRKWWVTAEGSKGPVVMRPLVVFDTMNAVIDVDDENANSGIGKVFAAIKASFPDYPVVVIAHLAKALKGRKDANELAVRGAGAIEADAHQIMYLVQEDSGDRYLIFGKTRFERKRGFDEIKFISHAKSVILDGEFGPEETILRWSEPQPVEADERSISRAEARKTEREESAKAKQNALIDEMVQLVKQHNDDGVLINRSNVYKIIGGHKETNYKAMDRAVALRKITEFTAKSGKRALYALAEHETVEAIVGGCVISATAEGVDRVESFSD